MAHQLNDNDKKYLRSYSIADTIVLSTSDEKSIKFRAYTTGNPDKCFTVSFIDKKTKLPDADAFYTLDQAIDFYNSL